MSGKSNFNTYEKSIYNHANVLSQEVLERSYSIHDFYMASTNLSLPISIGKNGMIGGVRL